MKRSALVIACVWVSVSLYSAVAQQTPAAQEIRAAYVKSEHMVPMRDGVKLFTIVYAPKDAAAPYPFMLHRTPYGSPPYGPDAYRASLGPSPAFASDKFIFVYQDVRGKFRSEGEFVVMRPLVPQPKPAGATDESTDNYDTIEWLVKNVPNNNGRVGQWGISYPGSQTVWGMIDAHPALKASSPQAPAIDMFLGDDFHHNGALYLAHTFHFFSGFGRPRPAPSSNGRPGIDIGTPDGYRFFLELGPLPNVKARFFGDSIAFWNRMTERPTYDEWWKARNILPHLRRMPPAVLTVGGWFDAEDLYGPLKVYEHTERQNPGIANHLLMGPWWHGGWSAGVDAIGAVRFGPTTPFYEDSMLVPFFRHWLEDGPDPRLAEATVFETGTNVWRRYPAWPPPEARPRALYLHRGGRLGWDAPAAASGAAAYDQYVSDPAKPVPYIGYVAPGMTIEHMVDDQRFAATRPDVLVYATPALEEDVTVAGPITVTLHVSTSGTDSDWVVKLIDVYPDSTSDPDPNPTAVRMGGYQQLVRGEAFRGRFRRGFERPRAFVPNRPEQVEYVMPDVSHTFRRGHRIMVQVQSSWFPLVDRNPQTFVDIYHARESDFQAATQRVYRSAAMPSRITVGVMPRQ
ncbi:MAG TPA: CocE/NonD family hydrolase [Longimicrobiaceae bacterium]|nr:CocE/NonD family hydrolase [Longimicrobiaceae bacterium]